MEHNMIRKNKDHVAIFD